VGELPRRKHIKFRRQGITQKKTYKIQTWGNYPEENIKFRRRGITQKKT